MRRRLALVVIAALAIPVEPALSQSTSPFHSLPFSDSRQYIVRCAASFECDIQLQAGERVNDGFNAHIDDWDPHIGYSGIEKVTPHLVLRPSTAGLRTNIILTTTKRTYYILALSTSRSEPSYYSFTYQDETFRELNRISLATQAALRAVGDQPRPIATPTPADVARVGSTCIDYDYSYAVERSLQPDHPAHARPSKDGLPKNLIPRIVCTDGQHTFIEFPRQQEVPSDLPISLAVSAEGDTLINYTYVQALNRFTIDGVYDTFALEIGSQDSPIRLRIYHASRGNPPPNAISLHPPGNLDTIDRPVVPMATPLITLDAGPPPPVAPVPAPTVFVPTAPPSAAMLPQPAPASYIMAQSSSVPIEPFSYIIAPPARLPQSLSPAAATKSAIDRVIVSIDVRPLPDLNKIFFTVLAPMSSNAGHDL